MIYKKYTGTIIHILFIPHCVHRISCCPHANHILSKLPLPHERYSRPALRVQTSKKWNWASPPKNDCEVNFYTHTHPWSSWCTKLFTFPFVNSCMQLPKQKVLPSSDSAETLLCMSHQNVLEMSQMQHQFRPNLSASAISVFSYCLESNLLHLTVLHDWFFSLEYQETLFQ
jgi:hypothetical protein